MLCAIFHNIQADKAKNSKMDGFICSIKTEKYLHFLEMRGAFRIYYLGVFWSHYLLYHYFHSHVTHKHQILLYTLPLQVHVQVCLSLSKKIAQFHKTTSTLSNICFLNEVSCIVSTAHAGKISHPIREQCKLTNYFWTSVIVWYWKTLDIHVPNMTNMLSVFQSLCTIHVIISTHY